jgi:hypothetical protein
MLYYVVLYSAGHAVQQVVEALRYKSEAGDSTPDGLNFIHITLGSKQPLTEMSTSNDFWDVKMTDAYG